MRDRNSVQYKIFKRIKSLNQIYGFQFKRQDVRYEKIYVDRHYRIVLYISGKSLEDKDVQEFKLSLEKKGFTVIVTPIPSVLDIEKRKELIISLLFAALKDRDAEIALERDAL